MNLYIRFIVCVLRNLAFPRKQSVFEETSLKLRVWPNDLDLNMHMNNGRFLTVMDIGRTDFVMKTGFHKLMLKRKWGAVVTAINVVFLKPLAPFAKYELKTRLLSWDNMWFYLEQSFIEGGSVKASAVVKATFLEGKKRIAPSEVVRLASDGAAPPEFPDYLKELIEGEEAFIARLKERNRN